MKGTAYLSETENSSPSAATDISTIPYVAAPFSKRFVALLIDQSIFYLFVMPVFSILGSFDDPGAALTRQESTTIQGWGLLAFWIACNHLVLASKGQTIGKFLMRCKIVRQDGAQASFLVVVARESAGKLISAFFGLGYLWAIFDKEKRTLHDCIMRTRVADIQKYNGHQESRDAGIA